jgi:hypothetical protein
MKQDSPSALNTEQVPNQIACWSRQQMVNTDGQVKVGAGILIDRAFVSVILAMDVLRVRACQSGVATEVHLVKPPQDARWAAGPLTIHGLA